MQHQPERTTFAAPGPAFEPAARAATDTSSLAPLDVERALNAGMLLSAHAPGRQMSKTPKFTYLCGALVCARRSVLRVRWSQHAQPPPRR